MDMQGHLCVNDDILGDFLRAIFVDYGYKWRSELVLLQSEQTLERRILGSAVA